MGMLDKIRETLRGLETGGLEPGSLGAYVFAFASIGLAALAHFAFAEITPDITPSIFTIWRSSSPRWLGESAQGLLPSV